MTENEKVLIIWLEYCLNTIKGEYPEDQWSFYQVPHIEGVIEQIKIGGGYEA
jgi:hypothetical protein